MRVKVSNLFLLSSVMSFIFMMLLFAITYIYFDKYQNAVKLLDHSNAVVSVAVDMIDVSTEMDLYLDMYKITNNTDYLTQYYESKNRFERTLDELHTLVKDDFGQSSRIILIQAIFSQWEENVMYRSLGNISNKEKAKELQTLDIKLHQDLKIQIDSFIDEENALQEERTEKQKQNLFMFLTIFPSAIVIIGLLMLSLNIYMTNLINKPIKQLVSMANRLGKKEFEAVPYSMPDPHQAVPEPIELSILHRNFIYMAEKLKKSYYELEELNLNLKAMNKSKDEFIAMVSHELRTPLNAIIGFSELLMDPDFGSLNQRQMSYVDDIRRAGVHQLAIINDLLDLAKIEAGNMGLQLEPVDPAAVIEDAVSTVAELAHDNNIELVTDISAVGRYPSILLDERKFTQILLNLLSNAIKFTPPGKKVGLSVSVDEHNLYMNIWDEGIGISQEDQERIFEKFAQIDSDLSRKYAGTGLGLPLVKSLVSLHGGTMSLVSEVGKGSTFSISIPLLIPHEDTSDELIIQSYKSKILVVTRDDEVVSLLRRYTSDMPVEVMISGDEDTAVSLLSGVDIRMAILDVTSGEGFAWPVLQRIKSDQGLAPIPVSVISADTYKDKAYQFGADDFITKPINRDILMDAITRNLSKVSHKEKKVLIIDDDVMVHRLFEGVLNQYNYILSYAEDGEAGLRMAREAPPDLIILDIVMPKLNGFEVLRELKQDEATSSIPVIILTSKDLSADETDILRRYNAPHYYTKGTVLGKIVETIANIKV